MRNALSGITDTAICISLLSVVVPAGRVRGDAGACTFVAQRAGQEKPVEDFTSAEAEGGAGAVEEAKTTE